MQTALIFDSELFDAIKANVNEFADKIQMQNKQIKIMKIGETIKF